MAAMCGRMDAGRSRDAHADLEIGGRQAQEIAFGLDQYIGEDRHGLARLDDVVNHLEAPEKCVAIYMDFHKRLQLLRREERKTRRSRRRRACG